MYYKLCKYLVASFIVFAFFGLTQASEINSNELICPSFKDLKYSDGKYSYFFEDHHLHLESSETSEFYDDTKFLNFHHIVSIAGTNISCEYKSPYSYYSLTLGPVGISGVTQEGNWTYDEKEFEDLPYVASSCGDSREQCKLIVNNDFNKKDFYVAWENKEGKVVINSISGKRLSTVVIAYHKNSGTISVPYNPAWRKNSINFSGHIDSDAGEIESDYMIQMDHNRESGDNNCHILVENKKIREYKCLFHGETFYIS